MNNEIEEIVVASSENTECMKSLLNLLETQYEDIKFRLYFSYTNQIYATHHPAIHNIQLFCDGYVDGWENAVESL